MRAFVVQAAAFEILTFAYAIRSQPTPDNTVPASPVGDQGAHGSSRGTDLRKEDAAS
jgi:hypothetical protein